MEGRKLRQLCLAGALFGVAVGAAAQEGYVTDNYGNIVRSLAGGCVTTEAWQPENAVAQCHPELAAFQEAQAQPAEQPRAMPAQPSRITRLISLEADTNFDFDQASLTDQGKEKLDEIISQVQGAQDPRIKLVGYTDRIGSESYNQQLAERRAQAVRDYLTENGVSADAIQVAARGEQNPVVSCEGLSGDALIECLRPNRRTEVEFSAFEVIEDSGEQGDTQQQEQGGESEQQ